MEQLDLTRWRCPEPLIQLKLWLRQAQTGQSLCIMLADSGSRRDIPTYLQRQGHRIVAQQESEARLALQVVVGAKQPS